RFAKRPAFARSRAPVHTEAVVPAMPDVFAIHEIISASFTSARVPNPPGTTRMSTAGFCENSKAGKIVRPPIIGTGSLERATQNTRKGALSSVRRDSTPGVRRVLEKTSKGPQTSRTSTSLKTRMPTFSGFICLLGAFLVRLAISFFPLDDRPRSGDYHTG